MTKKEFQELAQNVVILDGATGSNLMAAGMPKNACTEKWVLENPEILLKLQRDYVEAGSQIIYAPTFGANRKTLEKKGLGSEIGDLNRKLVALSKQAAAGKAFVAGDMTTSGIIWGIEDDYTDEDALKMYEEQISYLAEAGADLLIVETMISIDEAEAAVKAAKNVCDLPVMCSVTVNEQGWLCCGGRATDAVTTLQEAGADAVGINCSSGPEQLEELVRQMKAVAKVPLIVKPNAGLPELTKMGEVVYRTTADDFAAAMERLIGAGADLVGGCCGTTPEYIRKLRERVKALS